MSDKPENQEIENVETTPNTAKPEKTKVENTSVDFEEAERMRQRIAELNAENAKHRHKVKEYQSKWEGIDVDPETVKELLAKEAKAAEDRKKAEGKYEDLIRELNEKTQKEVETLRLEKEQVKQTMQSKLDKYLIEKELAEALNKEGVKTKVLNPHIRPNLKVVEDELGEYRTVVVDKDGEPRLNQSGKLMTITDLLTEMKSDEDFMPLFPAPEKSGMGSKAQDKPDTKSAPVRGYKRSEMTPLQKVEYQQKHGMEAYSKLPF